MQERVKRLREVELELQLEETKKLKRHVFEFSARLQQAQERLRDREWEGKKTVNTLSAYHRRHNSCDVGPNPYFPITQTQFNLENPQAPQKSAPQESPGFHEHPQNKFLKSSSIQTETQELSLKSQKFPVTPSEAFKSFQTSLSPYEQSEIFEYTEIYYIGINIEKVKEFTVSNNFGFDDEKGGYKLVNNDQIHYRYEVLEQLGKGAFGQVVKVFDHKSKEPLALKIIKNKPRFTEQGQTELKILHHLLQNDKKNQFSLVHIRKSFMFRNHFCLVFELLGPNLYTLLKSSNLQGLQIRYIRRYTFQIFQALSLLSKLRIIHCDLKPENILLTPNSKSSIKIIDFGSSCHKSNKIYTYIQSRFYRAPEILFGLDYTEAIDVWSLGCILVELYIGTPLFPAENEMELFSLMVELLGVPPEELVKGSKRAHVFFYSNLQPRVFVNSKSGSKKVAGRRVSEVLNGACSDFVDLVESKR